jgi:uncharacterized protein YdaU (DUF1376 family)
MANFAMPWVDADFRRKTTRLSRVQRTAYRDLLQACFDAGGILPDDDKVLARICDLDIRTWRKHRPVLQPFFYGGWRHHRIDADLQRIVETKERHARAGQKGGLATAMRWHRKH